MIGLEAHRPDLIEYRECLDVIENAVKQFTVDELEKMNARERQAGVEAIKWEEFKQTNHVSTISNKWLVVANHLHRVKKCSRFHHGM